MKNTGWLCPGCGHYHSPLVRTCPVCAPKPYTWFPRRWPEWVKK